MKTIMLCMLSVILAAAVVAPTQPERGATPIPRISGETLDGQTITLPAAAGGKVTLLLLGASKKGGDRTKPWKERFLADFGSNQQANYYVVALLERAPAMIRGMIRSGMRSGTPAAQREHVVVSTSGENDWLNYFHLTDDALPMVLLLDRNAQARWVYTGEFNAEKYRALKAATARAMGEK